MGNYESYRYTPIIYIEAISEEIKNGLVDADRYSQEIIDIIRQVSDYSFMYGKLLSYAIRIFFIDILANIPNKYISLELIENYVVGWMKNGETLEYLEHSIYTGLLKSLIDSDNREDWLKAEEIVEALISETYKTKDISLYFLSRAFSGEEGSEKLYRKIAEKFSVEFVDFMISQFQDWLIKKYPYDMSFVLDDNEWKIEIKYMGNNCFIFEVNDNIRKGDIYFDSIGDEKELSSTILKTLNIEKDRVSDLKINFNLLSKRYLAFSVNQNIFVKDKYEFEEKLELLKNVLKEFSFINPEYIRSKIEDFFENKHEAFVRIALFLIDANWDEYNTFFFASFLSQPAQFFDKHFIKNDIKTFLERNINKFSLEQKEKLSDCIINGPYYNASLYNDKNKMIYRLEWYYKIKHDRFFEKDI